MYLRVLCLCSHGCSFIEWITPILLWVVCRCLHSLAGSLPERWAQQLYDTLHFVRLVSDFQTFSGMSGGLLFLLYQPPTFLKTHMLIKRWSWWWSNVTVERCGLGVGLICFQQTTDLLKQKSVTKGKYWHVHKQVVDDYYFYILLWLKGSPGQLRWSLGYYFISPLWR